MCESEEGFPSLKFPIPNKTGKIHLLKGLPPSTQRLFRILKLEFVRLSFLQWMWLLVTCCDNWTSSAIQCSVNRPIGSRWGHFPASLSSGRRKIESHQVSLIFFLQICAIINVWSVAMEKRLFSLFSFPIYLTLDQVLTLLFECRVPAKGEFASKF